MKNYMHPELGSLEPEKGDWLAEEVDVFFLDSPADICFHGGKEGPTEEALEGYQWISSNWDEVLSLIEDKVYSFYESYQDEIGEVPDAESSEEIWGSEEVVNIYITDTHNFSITMRFSWQLDLDETFVTCYVEEGVCTAIEMD